MVNNYQLNFYNFIFQFLIQESMKRALEENEKQMKQMQQTYEEKLAEAKATVNKYLIEFLLYSL